MSTSAFDRTLGAPLIASWAMSILLTCNISSSRRYFKIYTQDALWRRVIVALVLGFDIVTIAMAYTFIYLYTISHWGDTVYYQKQHWPVSVYLISIGCTQAAVQIFLIARIHYITRKAWVTTILSIGPVTVFFGAIATATINLIYPMYIDRYRATTPVTVWLVLLLVTNLVICVTLIWRLNAQRKQTLEADVNAHWVRIKRVWYSAFFTGGVTSVICVILLAVYLCNPESNVPVALAGPMSSLYTLMVLMNLNHRPSPTALLDRGVAPLELHGQIVDVTSTVETKVFEVAYASGKDREW